MHLYLDVYQEAKQLLEDLPTAKTLFYKDVERIINAVNAATPGNLFDQKVSNFIKQTENNAKKSKYPETHVNQKMVNSLLDTLSETIDFNMDFDENNLNVEKLIEFKTNENAQLNKKDDQQ